MKRKVKRYDEGGILTDRYGNPVKSGSGETVKTRYGSSTSKEDRPTSSGVDDYASMGKRAGATSPFSGPKEYISESIKEDMDMPSKSASSSDEESTAGKGARNLALEEPEVSVKKKTVVKKIGAKRAGQTFPTRSEEKGSQAFPIRSEEKKVPPLRKIGEAIMGTMESASKPFRSSMYDKMKGRKAGGSIKMASGGKVSTASSRGDGIAQRGKTKGRIC